VLKERKTVGSTAVLLAYLPYADNEMVADEVRRTLAALAEVSGKPDTVLVKALQGKDPVSRAAAAEALARTTDKELQKSIRKLLEDSSPLVRFRVAMALIASREPGAVPVLIDLLPELSQTQAWQAEDLLFRVADGNEPPRVSLGPSRASREKARDGWQNWWKGHSDRVDLAKLNTRPRVMGFTVVVLLERGEVAELGQNNQVRWKVSNLTFPLDVQMLPGDRLLVAEYHAGKVTERNLKGDLLWQYRVVGPLVAQRLANGNTFIATDSQLIEVDRNGTRVSTFAFPTGERIMKAARLPSGETVCLTDDARVVRLDTSGREEKDKSFPVMIGKRLFGGRLYFSPKGGVLLPHNAENKVVEYDIHGKVVWQVRINQPVAAVRLPNGNTLVTTYLQNRAVEFDPAGKEVWEYQADTKVTRALRR
jgi:hypothetical protein